MKFMTSRETQELSSRPQLYFILISNSLTSQRYLAREPYCRLFTLPVLCLILDFFTT